MRQFRERERERGRERELWRESEGGRGFQNQDLFYFAMFNITYSSRLFDYIFKKDIFICINLESEGERKGGREG